MGHNVEKIYKFNVLCETKYVLGQFTHSFRGYTHLAIDAEERRSVSNVGVLGSGKN